MGMGKKSQAHWIMIALACLALGGCSSVGSASPGNPADSPGAAGPSHTAAAPGTSAAPAPTDAAGSPSPAGTGDSGPGARGMPGAPGESPSASSPAPGATPVADVPVVEYKGPIEHLFFHPLVAFPELAFDGDSISKGYDDWFVTVPEFKRMLDELYARDYVLVNLTSLYESVPSAQGPPVVRAKKLMLPAGKKPFVLSVDDINYYDYMRQNGNVWKLVPDADGTVTAWARTPDGEEKTSRDWELVPILDDFVKAHPDFSWQGAKGVLALTGYQGVLGYRTNDPESPTYQADKQAALDVIAKLKADGWLFASHSWGHLDVNKSSLERLKRDTQRWKKEVEPLTGPTDIFIYPYGSRVEDQDAKFAYLRSQGFDVFCSVGPEPYKIFKDGTLQMDRRHIDGVALRTQWKRLVPLFGDTPILDPARDAHAR